MTRNLTALFMAIGIGGCSGASTAKPETPLQAIKAMRSFAAAGKWDLYWECFSARGKGWIVAECSSSLAWEAYAQPINPNAGAGARRIIEKYEVTKHNLERKEGETSDAQCLRIAEFMGTRGPEFCKEVFSLHKEGAFPGSAEILIQEHGVNHSVVKIGSDLTCNLSMIGARWRVDGPAAPQ